MALRSFGCFVFRSAGFCPLENKMDGALAQLVERNTGSVEVSGSTPLGSTILLIQILDFTAFNDVNLVLFPQSFPHYSLVADVCWRTPADNFNNQGPTKFFVSDA
jgi:hypothetical protein